MKLGNQYRGLHDEELQFLNDTEAKKKKEEMRIAKWENDELKAYYDALAAKDRAPPPEIPGMGAAASPVAKKPATSGKAVRKDVKSLLKGVVVKKKPKVASAPVAKPTVPPPSTVSSSTPSIPPGGSGKEPLTALSKRSLSPDDDIEGGDKKQKTI